MCLSLLQRHSFVIRPHTLGPYQRANVCSSSLQSTRTRHDGFFFSNKKKVIHIHTTPQSSLLVVTKDPIVALFVFTYYYLITMGCTLSVHVANPQEEALQKEVEALRQAVAELQQVVQQQQQPEQSRGVDNVVVSSNSVKGDKPSLKPPRSKKFKKEEVPVEQAPSVSNISTSERAKEDGEVVVVDQQHPSPNELVAAVPPAIVTAPAEAVESYEDGDHVLRVSLKPTEVVVNLLQAAHVAETNALAHLESLTDNHAQAAEGWRAYRAFRLRYDSLLHGEPEKNNSKDSDDAAQPQEDDQEGGLLHFLGLPRDLDDKQGEEADIKAIEDSLDWRDDAKKALVRYRDARLAHIERVEDEILPRLEALQTAADQDDKAGHQTDDDEEDVDLDVLTKSVLFTHVLNPFVEDAAAFESFVRYVTRGLERTEPNKKAIRPFQNAIKAMAATGEQADLYKSWITNTRRTGILTERAMAKAEAAAKAGETEPPTETPSSAPVPEQPEAKQDPAVKEEKTEAKAEQAPQEQTLDKEEPAAVQEQAPPAQVAA